MGDFLDAGADQVVDSIDFLPHAIRRLRSRMVPVKTVFSFGGLSLDEGRWTMTVTERQADGSTKSATLTEITAVQRAMTKALVEAQGHPVNRQKLLRAARAEGYACPSEKNVDSQITELRRLFAELGVVFPVRAEISVGFCVY
jgi:DNA-binding response OmpR family regulator